MQHASCPRIAEQEIAAMTSCQACEKGYLSPSVFHCGLPVLMLKILSHTLSKADQVMILYGCKFLAVLCSEHQQLEHLGSLGFVIQHYHCATCACSRGRIMSIQCTNQKLDRHSMTSCISFHAAMLLLALSGCPLPCSAVCRLQMLLHHHRGKSGTMVMVLVAKSPRNCHY